MNAVYVVVPDSIDDPARPSGGNAYDRRICRGLATAGWLVREHAVPGSWPRPDAAARATLAGVLARIPDDAVVLLDGLIASTVSAQLLPEAGRLRLVVLMHMPLGHRQSGDVRAGEAAVLSAAAAVVTTSTWTRDWLLDQYRLHPGQVHIAEPGVDAADAVAETAAGNELLCVAAVTLEKGYDVLVAALAAISDLSWHCVCVGALDLEPAFVDWLRREAFEIGDRLQFVGTRTSDDLAAKYAAADVVVLGSRAETYGMVVTESLARAIPVIATAVGGVPATLGRAADGTRPGLLVPSGDAVALAAALRLWLSDADLRRRLRRAAEERRGTLPGWSVTIERFSRVLAEVAA